MWPCDEVNEAGVLDGLEDFDWDSFELGCEAAEHSFEAVLAQLPAAPVPNPGTIDLAEDHRQHEGEFQVTGFQNGGIPSEEPQAEGDGQAGKACGETYESQGHESLGHEDESGQAQDAGSQLIECKTTNAGIQVHK